MKSTAVVVALVVGVCLIISTALLASAIKDYGRSLERAALNQPRAWSMPSSFTVSVQGGGSPLRFEVNERP